MTIPIGVANSVSYNLDYDPVDTLNFALQSGYDLIQIYVNESQLDEGERLRTYQKKITAHSSLPFYFHAAGDFSQNGIQSTYTEQLFTYLDTYELSRIIFHFNESENLEIILGLLDKVVNDRRKIYLENYFQRPGSENAEKNLRKFLAVFSLANNIETRVFPVLDIPRFFNKETGFTAETALSWCYQFLNFFGNKNIPILLHLVDVHNAAQERSDFCALGEGIIPYPQIFSFMEKNRVPVEGIILEYQDKINPLKSRDYLRRIFK